MKYVIFDIDGTLVNTKNVEDKCFMKAFEETFGLNIENQKWEDFKNVTDWGITEEIIISEKGRTPLKEEYELMIQNFTRELEYEKQNDKSQFAEVLGAKEFFNELRKMEDVELGIATGAWEKSANIKLGSIGIDMKNISFSNSDYYKSREAITKDVVEQIKLKTKKEAERIIYFGDGEWDYKTCKNLGIEFIGIDIEEDDKLRKLGAQIVFKNYIKKEEILRVINKGAI